MIAQTPINKLDDSGRFWTIKKRPPFRNSEGEHVKQLIERKLYDTGNSTKLARWSNKSSIDDLWLEEILYKTAEGNYFICGTGGSLTPYAKHDETEPQAGCYIRLLTKHEAAVWTALRDEKDLLDTEFSGEIENT